MKKTSLVQKATLFCLAAALSMGIAKAGTTNLIYNYSFEIPGTGKIASGFDTVPGWFSSNPSPPATPDSGIQPGEDAPDGPFGPFNVNNYDAYTKGTDGYHARQTTSHLILPGECYMCSLWSKNEWVFGNAGGWTNGYWTVVLYYGGTQDVVSGSGSTAANTSLGTVGTPFFTNVFNILPAPGTAHSHTTPADWTNYFFGVITNAIPAAAISNYLGIDIWNSTTQYNSGANPADIWLDMDDVVLYATNGISPIATPIVVTPTNTVWTGGTLYFTENAFGSTPMNYEWQTDGGIPGGPMTDVPGDPNTNVLTVAASTTASTNNYWVIINNNYGSVTSTLAPYYVLGAVPPSITQQTGTADWGTITNIFAFVGGNVNFYASSYGAPVMTNQWDVKLDSGGGYTIIAGATNFLQVLTNVQTTKAGYYLLGATNGYGNSNSTPAHLTALAVPAALPAPANGYTTNMYSYGIYTNHPLAYWKFEETNDTLSQSMQAYDYSGHNFDATYGNSDGTTGSGCLDGGGTIKSTGQYGPGNYDGYSGFPVNNKCSTMAYNLDNGYLTVPPLNLNTNAVTFTMWIYINPANPQTILPGEGLFMNRNGSDAAGIYFGTNVRTNFPGYSSGVSIAELAYAWNSNSAATTGWHSGLYPWPGTWNFVACVIAPSSTTMYLYNANIGSYGSTNLYKAVNNVTNGPEAFSVASWLGSDGYNGSTFNGYMDEVAVFTNAMSESQIQYLFLTSLGLTNGVAPNILTQPPSSVSIYTGQPLLLSVLDGGIPTPTNAWRCSVDGATWMIITNANASGTNSPNLVVNNFPPNKWPAGATNFEVIVGNGVGNNVTSTKTIVKTYPTIPNYNNGAWVMNFAIATTNQNGTGNPFTGRGVLGSTSDSYWNALSAYTGQVTNVTALLDNGTPNSAATNVVFSSPVGGGLGSGSSLWTGVTNNMLLDTYIIVHGTTNSPTPFVFSNIPNGRYNLALYGCVGSWLNRAIQFTVLTNGVSAGTVAMTNQQDLLFAPNDNTAVFSNLLVLNKKLEVDIAAWPAPAPNTNATECEFNGAQLELVSYDYLPTFSSTNIGGNTVLNWSYGMLLQATNVFGPWTTNVATTASGSYTINPTGYMRFFRVYNPTNL